MVDIKEMRNCLLHIENLTFSCVVGTHKIQLKVIQTYFSHVLSFHSYEQNCVSLFSLLLFSTLSNFNNSSIDRCAMEIQLKNFSFLWCGSIEFSSDVWAPLCMHTLCKYRNQPTVCVIFRPLCYIAIYLRVFFTLFSF